MTKYQMLRKWKRSREDENVQLEALFDALYALKKVTEDDLFIYLSNKNTRNRGYIYPKREAVHHFMRYQLIYKGEPFLDKMNCYHHSPIDLANQIYERISKAIEHEDEGVAFYTCTGAPAVMGTIVCMGKMQDEKYITNPTDGAPRQLVDKLTPNDILLSFLEPENLSTKDSYDYRINQLSNEFGFLKIENPVAFTPLFTSF